MSLPSRGRGLKRRNCPGPCCPQKVAPFTGAWIETQNPSYNPTGYLSLPSRGRGLKP